ncbi:MAG: hypothetical protein WBV22_08665 [Anaerolineaceae bacterium]
MKERSNSPRRVGTRYKSQGITTNVAYLSSEAGSKIRRITGGIFC